MMLSLGLLIAAVLCAALAVLLLGPCPDWPGTPLQLVAASLACGYGSTLVGALEGRAK